MASHLIPLLLTMYIIIALINALGKDALVELAWKLYLLLPLQIRTQLKSQRSLQSTLLTTSATLKSTSAQDDFAKWARLNRQHDKQIQDLQNLTSAIESHKSKFRRGAKMLLWVGTTGVKGGVQWWFNRSAVFWLPAGTFPDWIEYVLAFPKAPRGSVSTMVFGMCATRVIGFVVGFVQDLVALRTPVANTPLNATGARVEEVTSAEDKKEL